MELTQECHVCGKMNKRIHWSEYGIGTVEDYYYCDQCGYFYEMAYSPYHEGIELMHSPIKLIKQFVILIKNRKKCRCLKFDQCHF